MNRFIISNIGGFLSLLKILRNENEFTIRFNHGNGHIDIESMMLASVVAVGLHFVPGENNMFTFSNSSMTDYKINTLRIDSATFLRVFVRLYKIKHTRIQLHVLEETSLCIECFDGDMKVGSGTVNSIDIDSTDSEYFQILQPDMCMSYTIIISRKWTELSPLFQASSTEETTVSYKGSSDKLSWTSKDDSSVVTLYTDLSEKERSVESVEICLLPSVVKLVRTILQFVEKRSITLSLSTELPLFSEASMDDSGSFIRLFAGTKEIL